jgi:hypothetical protein
MAENSKNDQALKKAGVTVDIPILRDGSVIVIPGLAYHLIGLQVSLTKLFMDDTGCKPDSYRVADQGAPLFDPPIDGYWSTKFELMPYSFLANYLRWLAGQAFAPDVNKKDDAWLINIQQVWLYTKPGLCLFPINSTMNYTPALLQTTHGPISWSKSAESPSLTLTTTKKFF